MEELENVIGELEKCLIIFFLFKDFNDEKNIMLEICVGIGGDEVSIWVGDLVCMYIRYVES